MNRDSLVGVLTVLIAGLGVCFQAQSASPLPAETINGNFAEMQQDAPVVQDVATPAVEELVPVTAEEVVTTETAPVETPIVEEPIVEDIPEEEAVAAPAVVVTEEVEEEVVSPAVIPAVTYDKVGYVFENPESVNNLKFGLQLVVPKDDGMWDNAPGVFFEGRRWFDHVGMAFSAGIEQWSVNTGTSHNQMWQVDEKNSSGSGESSSTTEYTGPRSIQVKLDGDALMFPLGASMLLRPNTGQKINLCLEAGARVIFSDSDVTANAWGEKIKMDLGEAIVGVISAVVDVPITSGIGFFAGIGYQFDLAKMEARMKHNYDRERGDVSEKFEGKYDEKISLEGLTARAGILVLY